MANLLYIIGNGFDIHHDIESRYNNFMKFVDRNQQLSIIANDYLFESEKDWKDFEKTLGLINPNGIYKNEEDENLDFKNEDFDERDIHRFNDIISYNLELLNDQFNIEFRNWIKNVYIPSRVECDEILLQINQKAKFLTFNYTNTLQKVYLINEDQINHLHGTVDNPIYGHGADEVIKFVGPEWSPSDEMLEVIQKFFTANKKPVYEIIAKHNDFFKSLKDIDEVYVIGHSLNDIDMPYFAEVVKNTNRSVKWIVTYRDKEDADHHRDKLTNMGLSTSNFKVIHIDKYNSLFNPLLL